MRIAVDIDGILTIDTEGHNYNNRIPNSENIDKLNQLYYKGHFIILYTARFWKDHKITKQWLKRHNVQYHKLIMDKLQYDIFVDDKSVVSFEQLNKKLRNEQNIHNLE